MCSQAGSKGAHGFDTHRTAPPAERDVAVLMRPTVSHSFKCKVFLRLMYLVLCSPTAKVPAALSLAGNRAELKQLLFIQARHEPHEWGRAGDTVNAMAVAAMSVQCDALCIRHQRSLVDASTPSLAGTLVRLAAEGNSVHQGSFVAACAARVR